MKTAVQTSFTHRGDSSRQELRIPLFRTITARDWQDAIRRPKNNAVSIQIKAAIAAKRLSP